MIVYSTPGSITWECDATHRITFIGEWTLEPKFYLSVPDVGYWDELAPKISLTKQKLHDVLVSLQADAERKGWVVEIEY